MAVLLIINGVTYNYPQLTDEGWGNDATNWAVAITQGTLQKSGGLFALTGDVDFGPSFGIKTIYVKSRSSNIALSGVLRLSNSDFIAFRNASNTADLAFGPGSSDAIPQYNGIDLVNLSSPQSLSNKTFITPIVTGNLVVSGTISASNFSGSSSGVNTGDVTLSGENYLSIAGQAITANPVNLSGSNVTSTLPIAKGGTGQTSQQSAINTLAGSVTSGQYLRGNGTNVLMSAIQVSDVPTLNQNTTGTANNITASSNSTLTTLSSLSLPGAQVTGNIPGNAANITASSNSTLTTLSSLSLPGTQVTGNISGNAANVTGIVAIANGGTNASSASVAFNNLSPMTSLGDIIYGGVSGAATRLAATTNGFILTLVGGIPSWQTASGVSFPILGPDGSPSAPTYSFSGATNMGMYRGGSTELDFAVGGVVKLRLGSTFIENEVATSFPLGSTVAPSIFFTGNSSTGLYFNSGFGAPTFTVSNADIISFTANYIRAFFPIFESDGSLSAPSYSFNSEQNTGIFRSASNIMSISVNGTQTVDFHSDRTRSRVPITVEVGSAAAPTYTFESDQSTGIYRSASGTIAFSNSGVQNYTFSASSFSTLQPMLEANGSVAAPSYSFTSTSNTGMYMIAANRLGFAVNGASQFEINNSYIRANLPVYIQDGTASLPSLGFLNDETTGIYGGGIGSGTINFTNSGVLGMTLNNSHNLNVVGSITSNAGFLSSPGSGISPLDVTANAARGLVVRGTDDGANGLIQIRANSGAKGYLSWVEAGVATRGFLGFEPGDGTLYYRPSSETGAAAFSITSSGDVGIELGDLKVKTAGKGLQIKEGSNAKMGVSTLVAGSVVVSTTAVTANSRIFLTGQNSSGTHGELTVSARTAGTSFTITSSGVTDTRDIAWILIEPA